MPLIDYAVPIEHPPNPFPTPGYNLINNSTNSYYNSFVISRRRNTGNSLTWPYIYCISLSLYKLIILHIFFYFFNFNCLFLDLYFLFY